MCTYTSDGVVFAYIKEEYYQVYIYIYIYICFVFFRSSSIYVGSWFYIMGSLFSRKDGRKFKYFQAWECLWNTVDFCSGCILKKKDAKELMCRYYCPAPTQKIVTMMSTRQCLCLHITFQPVSRFAQWVSEKLVFIYIP